MTGPAQHWYFMLERDTGEIPWQSFKTLCQQRFGLALGINHLADLARLPFRGSVSEYQDAFLAKMAHAGYLSPEQQVRLFTGGLPDSIRVAWNSKPPRIFSAPWLLLVLMNNEFQPLRPLLLPAGHRGHHHVSITSLDPCPPVHRQHCNLRILHPLHQQPLHQCLQPPHQRVQETYTL
jgi:hypothetical protein